MSQIFLKTLDGKTIYIDSIDFNHPTLTVEDLKQAILIKQGIKISNQDILYSGKVFANATYLHTLNLGGIGPLTLVVRPAEQSITERLLKITELYLTKNKRDPTKNKIFSDLKAILDNRDLSLFDRIKELNSKIGTIHQNNINLHRDPTWQRYLINVLSILSIFPAIVRSIISYNQYGTAKFWQPESKQAVNAIKKEIARTKLFDVSNQSRKIIFWCGDKNDVYGSKLVEDILPDLHKALPNVPIDIKKVCEVDTDPYADVIYIYIKVVGARVDVMWEDSANENLRAANGNCVWLIGSDETQRIVDEISSANLPSSQIIGADGEPIQLKKSFLFKTDHDFKTAHTDPQGVVQQILDVIRKKGWGDLITNKVTPSASDGYRMK